MDGCSSSTETVLTRPGAGDGCAILISVERCCGLLVITRCLQFYLLDDRLCYTDEPGKVEDVRYIPLDRIPVRALPRGYGPQIGVNVIEDRQVALMCCISIVVLAET